MNYLTWDDNNECTTELGRFHTYESAEDGQWYVNWAPQNSRDWITFAWAPNKRAVTKKAERRLGAIITSIVGSESIAA